MNAIRLTAILQGPTDSEDLLAMTAECLVVNLYNTSGREIRDVEVKVIFKDDDYDRIERKTYTPSRWEPGQSLRATLRDPEDNRDVEEVRIKFEGTIDGHRFRDSIELDRDDVRENCVFEGGACIYKHLWDIGPEASPMVPALRRSN
jgi:hypothetical protein